MTLGIVLVTYRCRDLALQCLASIERELPESLASTVVVDNHSGDGTIEALRERFPTVRCLQKQRNVGFAAAANAAMRALSDCEVVCLLNPDTVLLDAGLFQAACYLAEHPQIGVLGARIENEDGTLQPSCRAFPGHLTALFNRHSITTKLLPGNRWSQRYLMTDWAHDEVRKVDWVSGACMLIHRRAIDAVGVLDAGYFFSIEDVDYCRRVHDAGLSVAYYPMARVRHRVGGSSRHAVYRAMTAHHLGMWRYYRQHMRGNVLVDTLTAVGIGLRLGVHAVSYAARSTFERLPRQQRP
jgi:GT2 family glycosyltransferase